MGVPNNGNFTFPISALHASARYNLVGNPYPSALNLRAFLEENEGLIQNKFYFMEHTLETPAPSGQTNYGVLTISPEVEDNVYVRASSSLVNQGEFAQNEVIQPGQGFFVRAKDQNNEGNLVFNNSMRNTTGGAFFRQNNVASTNSHLFRVKMLTPNNYQNTAVVGYYDYASDGIDMMDTRGLGSPLYTLYGTDRFVIQGLATPFNPSSTIPMGVQVGVVGNYQFGINEVKGLFVDQQYVLLHDTQLGIYHNISLSDYQVELNTLGAIDDRFYLVFVPMLSVDVPEVTKGAVKMFVTDDVVQVKLLAQGAISQVKVYDMAGRLNAIVKEGATEQHWKLSDLQASKSIRVFEVTLENGTKEIIKLFY